MKKNKLEIPDYMSFAICSHNGLWPIPNEEEQSTQVSIYGGVAEYLSHDWEGYDEDEELEVEYKSKSK